MTDEEFKQLVENEQVILGHGVPGAETGRDLDMYVDQDTRRYYRKYNGEWSSSAEAVLGSLFLTGTPVKGDKGDPGTPGTDGKDARIDKVTVTVTPADSAEAASGSAVVTDGENGQNIALSLSLPRGDKGETGAAGTPGAQGEQGAAGADGKDAKIGNITATAESVESGTTPTVTATTSAGSDGATDIAFTFKIPKGETGAAGEAGAKGADGTPGKDGAPGAAAGFGTPEATVTTLNAGESATVTVTATEESPDTAKVFKFAFGIPRGADGTAAESGGGGTAAATTYFPPLVLRAPLFKKYKTTIYEGGDPLNMEISAVSPEKTTFPKTICDSKESKYSSYLKYFLGRDTSASSTALLAYPTTGIPVYNDFTEHAVLVDVTGLVKLSVESDTESEYNRLSPDPPWLLCVTWKSGSSTAYSTMMYPAYTHPSDLYVPFAVSADKEEDRTYLYLSDYGSGGHTNPITLAELKKKLDAITTE